MNSYNLPNSQTWIQTTKIFIAKSLDIYELTHHKEFQIKNPLLERAFGFSRADWIRTSDPYVPNVVPRGAGLLLSNSFLNLIPPFQLFISFSRFSAVVRSENVSTRIILNGLLLRVDRCNPSL
jgi:hypothetical protein